MDFLCAFALAVALCCLCLRVALCLLRFAVFCLLSARRPFTIPERLPAPGRSWPCPTTTRWRRSSAWAARRSGACSAPRTAPRRLPLPASRSPSLLSSRKLKLERKMRASPRRRPVECGLCEVWSGTRILAVVKMTQDGVAAVVEFSRVLSDGGVHVQ